MTTAVLDNEYRKMVSDAAGDAYLDTMTTECLAAVQSLLAQTLAPGEDVRARAHRLTGGTATVGLPALAASLRAIESACKTPGDPAAWEGLQAQAQARLAEAYAALDAEASTRSSR